MKSKTFLSCLVFIFFFLSSSSSSSIFSRHFPSIPSVSGLICTQNLTPSETSASLQAIIDSLGSSTSAVLCFSAGTYSFSNTLNVTAAGVTFQGPQSGIDPRPSASSTRSPTNAATEAIFSGASLTSGMPLISMQTDSITFDGLVLTGTPSGSFLNDLLRAEAKTGSTYNNFVVKYCVLHDSGDGMIRWNSASNYNVHHNYIYSSNFASHIHVSTNSSVGLIQNNQFEGPVNGYMILHETSNYLTISNNNFHVDSAKQNFNFTVIAIGSSSGDASYVGSIVSGNTIDCGEMSASMKYPDGIQIGFSNSEVSGNTIANCKGRGIFVFSSVSNSYIHDNVIRNNGINDGPYQTPAFALSTTVTYPASIAFVSNCVVDNEIGILTGSNNPVLNATGNYFGHLTGPYLGTGVPVSGTGWGDSINPSARINSANFLTQKNGCSRMITVSTPSSYWYTGQSGNIVNWNFDNSKGFDGQSLTVKIELISLTRGSSFVSVATQVSNSNGANSFSIPSVPSLGGDFSDVFIKVSVDSVGSPLNSVIYGFSDSSFEVDTAVKALSMSSPVSAGQYLISGQSKSLAWDMTGTLGNLTLVLMKGTSAVQTIVGNPGIAASALAFSGWTVPSVTAANDYFIRATSISFPSITSDSPTFEIDSVTKSISSISIAPPSQGYFPNNTNTFMSIAWSNTGNFFSGLDVKLMKSGAFVGKIASGVSTLSTSGSFNWPNVVDFGAGQSLLYSLQVCSTEFSSVCGNLATSFEIDVLKQFAIVSNVTTSPEYLLNGTSIISISFSSVGFIPGNVTISLVQNRTVVRLIANASASGTSLNWPVVLSPSNPASTLYSIKISSLSYSAVSSSTPFFEIDKAVKSLAILYPTTGDVWIAGTPANVTWKSTGNLGPLSLTLSKGGVADVFTISASNVDSGFYYWLQVSATLQAGTDYQARVAAINYPSIEATSANFEVSLGSRNVFILNPPTSWTILDLVTIDFLAVGQVGTVSLQLLKDGNLALQLFSGYDPTSDTSFQWVVSNSLTRSANYTLLLKSDILSDVSYQSPAFEIDVLKSLAVTSPSLSTISVARLQDLTISWSSTGFVFPLQIELFANSSFEMTIASDVMSGNSFNWNVPLSLDIGSGYEVEVRSSAYSWLNSTSASFEIEMELPSPSSSSSNQAVSSSSTNVDSSVSAGSSQKSNQQSGSIGASSSSSSSKSSAVIAAAVVISVFGGIFLLIVLIVILVVIVVAAIFINKRIQREKKIKKMLGNDKQAAPSRPSAPSFNENL